jgi:hypothetical protein
MFSVRLWYTHELHCLMRYTNVLYISCMCYLSDDGPYIILVCNGNVIKLPISTFFGLINTHELFFTYPYVCSYAVI